MAPSLTGPLLKIERAKKHIRDLDVAIRAFCDSKPYTLGINEKPHVTQMAFYVRNIQPVPNEIALIVGDAIHNLRSAFDHLMCQLVEAGGGVPGHKTHFPIHKIPDNYATAIQKGEIDKIGAGAKELLRSIQPYVSGDNTLWYIHALDRIDKHSLIVTVAITTNAWLIDITGKIFTFPMLVSGPLITDNELLHIPISTHERIGHENFEVGLDISFGQSEVVAGKPVLETLKHMADLSDTLIRQFEPFLG